MGDGARGLAHAFQQAAVEAAADNAVLATLDTADLTRRLAALYERARAAHPGLAVTEAAFGRYLARAVAAAGCSGTVLEALAVEDLYLACACAGGTPGAVAAFDACFGKVIRRAIAGVLAARHQREEAEQRARQHLFVADGTAPPKIAKYLGQGPLESWVSVAAIRVAISLGRAETAELRLREKAIAEAAGPSPEILYMKGEVRRELEMAVEEALQRLDDRERLVLRLYLVGGMTLAAIGKTFGVTQQTVSRWLQKARDSVLSDVERALVERLKLPSDDVTSMIRFVASQLDISISRLLAAP
jgi:RNA polymerase sigma-70 factor (ECF subfamily)